MKKLFLCVLFAANILRADDPMNVVATLSTFADLVKTIGGDHVQVTSIAPPNFNPHFIEPRPSDVLKVKRADLFVHAGLDLEAWRDPLLEAAGNPRLMIHGDRSLDLSRGIALLNIPAATATRALGDLHVYGNPHYWIHPENGKIMARTITEKLSSIDPSHAQDYQKALEVFLEKLDQSIKTWTKQLQPHRGAEFIAYHDEWPYLLQFAGMKADVFLEPKPGIPPSPKHLELLNHYIQDHRVAGLIQSSFEPKAAAQNLAKKTKRPLALLCQNVGENKETINYIAMLDYNVKQLVEMLEKNE